MASSSGSNKKFFPHGSITELFCYRPSSVVLMDYDKEMRMLGLGQFIVYLMMQTFHPIMITVCSIDGFHFPLTKDTVIFRMAKRTFAFALPGLLYGLQFPHYCDEALMDNLEKIFLKFGHYCKVLVEDKGLGNYSITDTDMLIWYKLRLRVEPMAHEILSNLGLLQGKSRFSVSNHNPCYLRAIRMSAITKVIEDALINLGTITDSLIKVSGTNPPNHQQPNDIISQTSAFASASVFTCLVDSLESNEVIESGLGNLIKNVEPPFQSGFTKLGFKIWKLNERGFAAFVNKLGGAVEEEEESMKEKKEQWKVEKARLEAAGISISFVGPDVKGKSVKN